MAHHEGDPLWLAVYDIKAAQEGTHERMTSMERMIESSYKILEKISDSQRRMEDCQSANEKVVGVMGEKVDSTQRELTEHKNAHWAVYGLVAALTGAVTWLIDGVRGK